MNNLLDILSEFGFSRLSTTLKLPIVVHCVPGAGKSRAIRELLKRDRSFKAYTLGKADPQTIEGADLLKFTGSLDLSRNCILDEYHLTTKLPEGIFAVFGDPQQSRGDRDFCRPDFVCTLTRRFGHSTASLLQSFGFSITANKEDSLRVEGIFEGEPEGQIVYFERCVGELLRSNCATSLHILECIGATYEKVTFVTTGEVKPSELHLHYLCLTRHTTSLLILTPDATYSAA